MRSIEEQMKEILRRKETYLVLKQFRRLAFLGAGLGFLLIAALLLVPGIKGTVPQPRASTLGATILGPEAGGYVIVGLLAFALGVVITVLIQRRKKAQGMKASQEHGPAGNP